MNIEQAKQIDLVAFLASIGHHPQTIKGDKYWYNSPLRNEAKASFKVNKVMNLWFDFGTGEGGNIILLVKRMHNINDVSQVLRIIEERTPASASCHNKPPCKKEDTTPVWQDVLIQPLRNEVLFNYAISRGIFPHIVFKYCQEVSYTLNNRRYFLLGFPNDNGGYELRNAYFKGCMGTKDVTFLKGGQTSEDGKRVCLMFEGIFSYMSYLVLVELGVFPKSDNEPSDAIVLNSVANLPKVLDKLVDYDRIYTYLDNDDAGKSATEEIKGSYPDKVKDFAIIYDFYNDLNDYLCDWLKDKRENNNQVQ